MVTQMGFHVQKRHGRVSINCWHFSLYLRCCTRKIYIKLNSMLCLPTLQLKVMQEQKGHKSATSLLVVAEVSKCSRYLTPLHSTTRKKNKSNFPYASFCRSSRSAHHCMLQSYKNLQGIRQYIDRYISKTSSSTLLQRAILPNRLN